MMFLAYEKKKYARDVAEVTFARAHIFFPIIAKKIGVTGVTVLLLPIFGVLTPFSR